MSEEDINLDRMENVSPDEGDLLAEAQKYKDAYVRAMAEMENLKKRTLSELDKKEKYAVGSFAQSLLAVADALERALAHLPPPKKRTKELDSFVEGILMTQKELLSAFEKKGIRPMEDEGAAFDPHFHKAVQMVERDDVAEGTIVSVFQTGYVIFERVLREAMVVVAQPPSSSSPKKHLDTTA